MIGDIILTVVVTLIVNEVTGVSPWLATRLVRWAAKHIYATDADRAAQREEEWEALHRLDTDSHRKALLRAELRLRRTVLGRVAGHADCTRRYV